MWRLNDFVDLSPNSESSWCQHIGLMRALCQWEVTDQMLSDNGAVFGELALYPIDQKALG